MEASTPRFAASYDSTTKIVTAVVCVFLAVISATMSSAVVAGIGALTICLGYAYSPRSYAIVDRSIVVRRLIGNVTVPLDDIREIRMVTADDLRGCLRLWGSGGLFGYYGLFRTSSLGKSTWYVTNRRNMIVVITATKTVLVSPDEADDFLAAIGKAVLVPQIASDAVRPKGSSPFVPILIACAVAAAVIAFVAFAILYSPGPPSYTLTSETLAIHDRFYPVTMNATAIDVAGIRIVDFDVDKDWRPVMRTNGFANAHYRSGWFKVASGKKVRMYRADSMRLVLLPAKSDGDTVLLEVALPEKFIETLRLQWLR